MPAAEITSVKRWSSLGILPMAPVRSFLPITVTMTGRTVMASANWKNIGWLTDIFDVLSLYGTYDEATNTFHADFGTYIPDVSVEAGASTTSTLGTKIPEGFGGKTLDGMAVICEYDPDTGEIGTVYANFYTAGAIRILR